MHYLGQAGISNYTSVYDIRNVVGSAVVAVVASIVALSVFFVLRATWTNSWWKRALCAIVLAGAVSGMHWLASVGTEYRLNRVLSNSPPSNISRNATVIVVIVLVGDRFSSYSPTKRARLTKSSRLELA
jgi:NO-binding membrane sensor protein with MHYT domain